MDRGVRDGNTDRLVLSKLFPAWFRIGRSLFSFPLFWVTPKSALKIERLMDRLGKRAPRTCSSAGIPFFFHLCLFRPSRFCCFSHARALSNPGGSTALGTSLRHISRPITTVCVGRALRYLLAAGAVKFRRMPLVFWTGIHSLSAFHYAIGAMQGLARRVNTLTQPFVHWYFFILFFVVVSVVRVHRGSRPLLADTATSGRPSRGGR